VIRMRGGGHRSGDVTANSQAIPVPGREVPELVIGGTRAERARLTAMFNAHYDFVWRSVRRLGVTDEAVDDAAQEVFVVASRRLAAIEEGKEKAFLFGTAVRVASDARRARGRRREQADDALDESTSDGVPADELLDQKRARELLDDIVAHLPDDTRDVIVLFELEGMTMAEIAVCLELKPGTVASRLRRAREMFEAAIARARAGGRGR
jgi:RNA polymerase sigma-70 factor (ECF subfamily)